MTCVPLVAVIPAKAKGHYYLALEVVETIGRPVGTRTPDFYRVNLTPVVYLVGSSRPSLHHDSSC